MKGECEQCGTGLVEGAKFCHGCGRAVGVKVRGVSRVWMKVEKGCLIAGMVACAITWVLIWAVSAKAVIECAPVIVLLGVGLAVAAGRLRHGAGVLVGLSHCGVCVLYAVLVNLLAWSPQSARVPFLVMGLPYILVVGGWSACVYRRVPDPMPDPARCRGCGYLLYGLVEPRCPECGMGFDPAEVPALGE